MRRTKEEAAQTREEIFKAGLRVFSEKGFAAATMSDVAREAGITRGAIYWHFRNKNDFFREITGRLSTHYQQVMGRAVAEGGPSVAVIRTAIAGLIRRFQEDLEWRAMQELVIRATLNHDGFSGELQELRNEREAVEILAEGIQRGEIYDGWRPETALFCLGSAMSGIFLHISQFDRKLSDREIGEIADFVARGMGGTGRIGGADET